MWRLLLPRQKKLCNIGGRLLLTAAKDICLELFGKATAIKVGLVHLPGNTDKRRTDEMAEDVTNCLTDSMNPCGMTFKWTDMENKTILLVYVRYIYQDHLQEDLLYALFLQQKQQ